MPQSSRRTRFPTRRKRDSTAIFQHPAWQALLLMAIPGTIIVLLQGAFIFVSQLMTVDLIPIDHVHTAAAIWGSTYGPATTWLTHYNATHTVKLPIYNVRDIAKSANSFTAPLIFVVTACVMWACQGSSTLYSQALGKKNQWLATNIYYQAIIVSAVVCTIMLILMYGCAHIWIQNEANAPHHYEGAFPAAVRTYYTIYSQTGIHWAEQFIYIYLATTYIQGATWIMTYAIIAEGKNTMATIFTLVTQVVGMFFTFVFVYWAHLEMMSPAIAALIMYAGNLGMDVGYILVLEKRAETNARIRLGHPLKWSWHDAYMMLFLGTTSFGKNLISAFLTSFSLQALNEANAVINGAGAAMFYSTVYGIVLPIYGLFASSLAGLARASRAVAAFARGRNEFHKVRQIYWLSNLYVFVWGTIIFFVIVFLLGGYKMPGAWGEYGPIIGIFGLNAHVNAHQYAQVQYVLMIYMLQIPFFGFGNSAQIIFQADKKAIWNVVSVIFQVVVIIPLVFILKAAAIHTHNLQPMLWFPFIYGIIASVVVGIAGIIFVYIFFKREELKCRQQHAQKVLDVHQLQAMAWADVKPMLTTTDHPNTPVAPEPTASHNKK